MSMGQKESRHKWIINVHNFFRSQKGLIVDYEDTSFFQHNAANTIAQLRHYLLNVAISMCH